MIEIVDIKVNKRLTSYGVGGAGFYEHRGITVTFDNGEEYKGYFKFNPHGYGAFQVVKDENDYRPLDMRMHNHHRQYAERVELVFKKVLERLNKLVNQEYKNLTEAKRSVRNAGIA